MIYSVKEAKDKFSEVIKAAETGQPQIIRRHEKEVAVVVSIDDWNQAMGKRPTLFEILRTSPLVGFDLDLSRQPDFPREVNFGE